jgi:hypothetical protein
VIFGSALFNTIERYTESFSRTPKTNKNIEKAAVFISLEALNTLICANRRKRGRD